MKISPHRRVRKYLNFYKSHFDFKTPYQIVIDETFCLEALTCQLNFIEQAPKYLEDESSKISTTACVIKATKKLVFKKIVSLNFEKNWFSLIDLSQKGADALKIVRELEVRTCCHGDEPVTSTECLFSLVKKNNPDHLFVATQNHELVNKCRSVASVPVLYVLNNFVCLENPESSRTHQVKRKATFDAPNPKKKKPTQAKGGSNQPAHKDTSVNQVKKRTVKQYRKKVPDQNQQPGQEQNPFQLQKSNFKRLNSNVGHQKKFGGRKGKNFPKQFKKKPFGKKA